MNLTQGKGVSQGAVKGRLYFYQRQAAVVKKEAEHSPEEERERLSPGDISLPPTFPAIGTDELSVPPSVVFPLRTEIRKSIAKTCTPGRLEG